MTGRAEDGPASQRPRRRTALAVLALALLGVLELACLAGWWLMEGGAFSWAAARRQRAELAAAAAPPPAAPEAAPIPGIDDLEGLDDFFEGQVVQPFLGFVHTPELNLVGDHRREHLKISEEGFYVYRNSRREPSRNPLRVGIFGGSVAFVLSFQGRETLADLVAEAVPERGVMVESWALGGFKQPQQLMTLTWLLARGKAPEVVINLDGFNDITLPLAENLPRGVNPFYPRGWERRVRNVPDPRYQALLAEAAYLERRRGRLAAGFSRPVLRWSVTWNFLWRWLDRRAAAAAAEAQARLSAFRLPEEPYAARGPAFDAEGERALHELVALWARSSLQMHRLATAAGGHYLHVLQPNQYVPGSKPLSPEERRIAFHPESPFRAAVESGHPRLRAAGERLAAKGVAFLDLTDVFADHTGSVYQDTCCHLNPAGNEIVARAIAERLVEELSR